ncbi:MAG TPA: DUF4238 domain-containing protein [Candidatus Limnocylindria bacterium]|nr:DUF4238 domain-containing protein [Candidatus Limnocylindria bacterium]
MSNEYRNNHYVPVWYQKRFVPVGQQAQEIHYLDLRPGYFVDPRGIAHSKRALRRQGFRKCFAEDNLYTTKFGAEESKNIEKHFFGEIDDKGSCSVDFFAKFDHTGMEDGAFQNLVMYMSTQKLRTPKGLEWLALQAGTKDKNAILSLMTQLRRLHCAIWTECVWLIADASKSETKFIVSDHPVTVYNRRCGPKSQWCRGANDPDIRYHATHTIFPLSLEKVLILTNLSWVRNPYQSETGIRPNPNLFRGSIFNVLGVQILRSFSEQEVREINFIIKSRARRYIGAGKEEWLFPEKHVSKSNWNTYGHGYLLMPDPRDVTYGGEMYMGFSDGTSTAFDPYGRRPGQPDFGKESRENSEFDTLQRFQGEFARLFGPYRRGRSREIAELSPERDDEWYHQYHLSLEKKKRR